MGRSVLLAQPIVPPSAETIKAIGATLCIDDAASIDGPHLLRSMRTKLNLTQREFGTLITPSHLTPVSASVICQLETGQQPVPGIVVTYAAQATAALKKYGEWLQQQTGAESWSATLKAPCPELQPYPGSGGAAAEADRAIVTEFLQIVTNRKQTGVGDRPATRGPYKKKEGKATKENAGTAKEGKGGPVAAPLKKPAVSRGPRGPYKVKKKKPEAEPLATGDAAAPPACGASGSDDDSASPPYMISSRSSSSGSGSSSSVGGSSCTSEDSARSDRSGGEGSSICGSSRPRSPGLAPGCQRLADLSLVGLGAPPTPRPCPGVDFLERLECAEKRDQEILMSLGHDLGPAQSERSPTSKRRAVAPVGHALATISQPMVSVEPARAEEQLEGLDVNMTASFDSLTLDDFLPSLESESASSGASSPMHEMGDCGDFAVEELLELVDGDL